MATYIKDKLSMYSKTILVVDDVLLFTKIATDFFRRDQVNLLIARSGPEAVEIIKTSMPDMVFMDLYMPGGDGDEACKEIKSDSRLKSIPIIIMTSSEHSGDIERCRRAGCNDFIHKPLTRDRVLNLYRKHLKAPAWSGKRVKVSLQAAFGVYSTKEFSGAINDLSVGGLFVASEKILPTNSSVFMAFSLHDSQAPIQCKGRVAWINSKTEPVKPSAPSGMGIEFIDLKTLDLLTIQSWLSKLE